MKHRTRTAEQPEPLTRDAALAGVGASPTQGEALSAYVSLLEKWQRRINLVGANTLADPWRRHVLDSAQLVPHLVGTADGGPVIDIGSGAGFPGLVLAILGVPGVVLIESDARKCAFLREAVRATDADAMVHHGRAEAYGGPPAAVVTARAVADLTALLTLSRPLLRDDGLCLFLKGRRWRDELTAAKALWHIDADYQPSRTEPEAAVLLIRRFRPKS